MVKTRITIGILLLLAVSGVLAWRSCGDPDIRAIRRQFDKGVESARVTQRENALVAASQTRKLTSLVTEDFQLGTRLLPFAIYSREQLGVAILRTRTVFDGFTIEPHDVDLVLAEDRLSATMTLSVKISITGPAGRDSQWKNVQIQWVKQDDEWLIHRVKAVEPIQQPF